MTTALPLPDDTTTNDLARQLVDGVVRRMPRKYRDDPVYYLRRVIPWWHLEKLPAWHKATDVDLLLYCGDCDQPLALIEAKHINYSHQQPTQQMRAQQLVARRSHMDYVVMYHDHTRPVAASVLTNGDPTRRHDLNGEPVIVSYLHMLRKQHDATSHRHRHGV